MVRSRADSPAAQERRARSLAGPVQTRTIERNRRGFSSHGWTLRDAQDLVRAGYSPEHTARRTGWPVERLQAGHQPDSANGN